MNFLTMKKLSIGSFLNLSFLMLALDQSLGVEARSNIDEETRDS